MQTGGKRMSIKVVSDSETRKWKVLIDGIQRGVALSMAQAANREAQRIHDKEAPHASLSLAPIN
jgi:hypothetical protein